MKAFTEVRSIVLPMPLSDVDTDMILPAEFLTSVSRSGFGENLFRRLRDENPTFPLNNPSYAGAQILLANENFGCGSSREHAVWALQGYGFQVILAKSFADIFTSNSGKNGLLLIKLPGQVIDELHRKAADHPFAMTVQLAEQKIQVEDEPAFSFDYDPFRKHCFLHGLDDLDYILAEKEVINKFFSHR